MNGKKIMLAVAAVLVMLIPLYASANDVHETYTEPSKNNALLSVGIKNDNMSFVNEAELKLKKNSAEKVKEQADKHAYVGGNRFEIIENYKRNTLDVERAKIELGLAYQKKLVQDMSKKIEIYNKVENAILASYKSKVSVDGIIYAKKAFEISELMNSLGKNTKTDLLQAEVFYKNELLADLEKENAKDNAYLQLKRELGIDLNEDIDVQHDFYAVSLPEYDYEKHIDEYAKNQVDVIEIKLNYDEGKALYEKYKEHYEEDDVDLISAYYKMRLAQREYKNKVKIKEVKIQKVYDSIAFKKELAAAKLKEEKALRQKTDKLKLMYDMGKVSLIDYLSTVKTLKDKEVEKLSAQQDYNKAVREFLEYKANSDERQMAVKMANREWGKID